VIVAMEDAGFIIGSYVVTFVAVAVYAFTVLRRARRTTSRLPDDAKPWT
jgi:heme exporter protein CcmD